MYLEQYKRILNDYPIFMAIAEDIGYDANVVNLSPEH